MGERLVRAQTFDLVISDIVLPKVNGFELTRIIRELYPDLPIIMLTALGTTDDKLVGFDSGVNDYMVKPFDFPGVECPYQSPVEKERHAVNEEPSVILHYNGLEMNTATKTVYRDGQESG